MKQSPNKRGIAFATVVQGILMVLALAIVIQIGATGIGKGGKTILGINTAQLNKELAERFDLQEKEFEIPGNSMLGLTYAINSLAYLNYHEKDRKQTIPSIRAASGAATTETTKSSAVIELRPEMPKPECDSEKCFGKTNINKVPYGLKHLTLSNADNKEKSYMKLTLAVLECWRRFEDSSRQNQNCNNLKVANDVSWEKISFSELEDWVEAHDCYTDETVCTGDSKIHQELETTYFPDNKQLARELTGLTDDIWGGISNIQFKISSPKNIEKGKNYVICANGAGINDIFITDNWEEECDTDKMVLGNNQYSYLVEDFELPQPYEEILANNQVGGKWSGWIDSHGDPKYVVYYEAFPKGEEEVWEISTFSSVLKSVVLAAGLGTVFDIGTVGIGRGWGYLVAKKTFFKLIDTAGRKTANFAIKGLQTTLTAGTRALSELYKLFAKDAQTQIKKKVIENAMMIAIRTQETWITHFGRNLGSDAEEQAAKKLSQIITNRIAHSPAHYLDAKNRLSKEGAERLTKALSEEIGEQGLEGIGKKGINDIIEATIKGAAWRFDDAFIADAIKASNTRAFLIGILEQSDDIAKDVLEKQLSATTTQILANMDDATFRQVLNEHKRIINTHLWNTATGDLAWGGGFEGIDNAVAKQLAEKFARNLPKDIENNKFSELMLSGTKKFFFGDNQILPKKRYIAAVTLAIWYSYEQNKMEKFRNVGENAIGLRTPYTNTITYGQQEFTPNLLNVKTDKTEFLNNYGTQQQGLLPEVNKYYLQLIRDRLPWWPDQDPQRFFLASPCKADLYLHIDQCECYGKEDPEEGVFGYNKAYPAQGKNEIPFEGGEMLYTLESNMPVRKCDAASWYSNRYIWSTVKKSDCIKINPIIETGYNNGYNFCYEGSHATADMFKIGVRVGQIVATWGTFTAALAACGIATVGTVGAAAGPCVPALIALAKVSIEAGLVAESTIHGITEKYTKWPLHGSGT